MARTSVRKVRNDSRKYAPRRSMAFSKSQSRIAWLIAWLVFTHSISGRRVILLLIIPMRLGSSTASASSTASTNKAVLTPQADRSITASGNADKGEYTITMKTSLNNITGFRLEALSDPKLPSKGPGLSPNGNFVLTEFEIFAAAAEKPKESAKVVIASGIADFLQGGFAIDQTFNGQTRNQQGWAVAGATGVEHWADYAAMDGA